MMSTTIHIWGSEIGGNPLSMVTTYCFKLIESQGVLPSPPVPLPCSNRALKARLHLSFKSSKVKGSSYYVSLVVDDSLPNSFPVEHVSITAHRRLHSLT